MGRWGEPFLEKQIYSPGYGKRILVTKTYIDHLQTVPFTFTKNHSPKEIADNRVLLGVDITGDISKEEAASMRDWIMGGLKEPIPDFLRVAANLEPKGERDMGEKIELGCKAKDSVTGFVGTVTARCEYLAGESRVVIEGLAEGKPVELWVAQSRCEVVAE
jgi:hypothetical protein